MNQLSYNQSINPLSLFWIAVLPSPFPSSAFFSLINNDTKIACFSSSSFFLTVPLFHPVWPESLALIFQEAVLLQETEPTNWLARMIYFRDNGPTGMAYSIVYPSEQPSRLHLLMHPYWQGVLFSIGVFITASLGITWLYEKAYEAQFEAVRTNLADISRIATSQLNVAAHDEIRGPQDLHSPQYDAVVEPLIKIHNSTPDIYYLYTMRIENGQFCFIADTATRRDQLTTHYHLEASKPLEPYKFTPDEFRALAKAIINHKTFVSSHLISDNYGTFITGATPFYDKTGAFRGLVGVDFEVHDLNQRMAGIRHSAFWGLVIAAVTSIMCGAVFARIRMMTHRAEQIRRAVEKNLRDMAENVPGVIFQAFCDREGKRGFRYMSPRSQEIFGFEAQEALVHGRIPNIYIKDRLSFYRSMDIALSKRAPWHFEGRIIKGTDELRWFRGIARGFFDPQKEEHIYNGVLIDITEEKLAQETLQNSEQRLRALLKAMPDEVFVLNKNGVYLEVMHSCDQSADVCNWITLSTRFDQENSSKLLAVQEKTLQLGQPQQVEYCSSGRWFEARSSLLNLIGQPPSVLWVARDITERKQSEEKLREAMDLAQSANRFKSDFLANMSHEIRTPLNGVLGMVSILETTPLNAEQTESLDIIKRSSELLLSVINDILDISKIEAGRMEIEHVPFELKKSLMAIVDLLQVKAGEKGVYVEAIETTPIPAYAWGDEARLQQILMNLLGNAIKFTEKGTITVEFAAAPSEKPKQFVFTITVKDPGIGIPPEKLSSIFEPFKQAHSYTTRKYGGTGLGLTICKKLAQLMLGSVSVTSELGKGSTFIATVLLEEALGAMVRQKAHNPFAVFSANSASTKTLKILLAEDNLINQKVALKVLEKLGYKADVANNGLEAIRQLEKIPYDLILMDMQMPEMDGLEATRQICTRWGDKRPYIVALTAHALKEQVEECLNAGMDAFLTKPIRPAELSEQLEKLRLVSKN